MKRSNRIRRQYICLVASNLYCHCRRTRKQRREEDFVLNDDIRTRRWLPRRVACSSVAGTGRGGRETVPEVELLFCDPWLTGLVRLDVIREEITPVVVRHVIDIGFGALWNTLFLDWADIVGFAVVIPGKNLLCQFPF